MPEKITLTNQNGESVQIDLITCFNVNSKKVVITTKNELDPSGLTILNVSEISDSKLLPITDDSLWDEIKKCMRTIISGSDSFTYESLESTALLCDAIYSKDISVERAAKDAMVQDYINKKPVEVVQPQTVNASENVENPFNGSVYPSEGNTPVVQNMSDVPVASAIAPGISEVAPVLPVEENVSASVQPDLGTQFEAVSNLENPVELMYQQQAPISQEMTSVPNLQQNNMIIQPEMNQSFDFGQVNDQQFQALIEAGASDEQFLQTGLEKSIAVMTNCFSALAQKKKLEEAIRNAELDRRAAEIEQREKEHEAKIASQYAMPNINNMNNMPQQPMMQQPPMQQQPVMQQPMMQQQIPNQMMGMNQMPVQQQAYPTPQNMISEMNNQGQVLNFPNENGSFKQVA